MMLMMRIYLLSSSVSHLISSFGGPVRKKSDAIPTETVADPSTKKIHFHELKPVFPPSLPMLLANNPHNAPAADARAIKQESRKASF